MADTTDNSAKIKELQEKQTAIDTEIRELGNKLTAQEKAEEGAKESLSAADSVVSRCKENLETVQSYYDNVTETVKIAQDNLNAINPEDTDAYNKGQEILDEAIGNQKIAQTQLEEAESNLEEAKNNQVTALENYQVTSTSVYETKEKIKDLTEESNEISDEIFDLKHGLSTEKTIYTKTDDPELGRCSFCTQEDGTPSPLSRNAAGTLYCRFCGKTAEVKSSSSTSSDSDSSDSSDSSSEDSNSSTDNSSSTSSSTVSNSGGTVSSINTSSSQGDTGGVRSVKHNEIRGFYYDHQRLDPSFMISLHPNTRPALQADKNGEVVWVNNLNNQADKICKTHFDNEWAEYLTRGYDGTAAAEVKDGYLPILTENQHLDKDNKDITHWNRYYAEPLVTSIFTDDFNFSTSNEWSAQDGGNAIESIFKNMKPYAPMATALGDSLEKAGDSMKDENSFGSSIVSGLSSFLGPAARSLQKAGNFLNKSLYIQGTRYSMYNGTSTSFGSMSMKVTLLSEWKETYPESGEYKFVTVYDQLNRIYPYYMGFYSKAIGGLGCLWNNTKLEGKITHAVDKFIEEYAGWQSPPGGFEAATKNIDVVQKGTLRLLFGGYYTIDNVVIKNVTVNLSRQLCKRPDQDGMVPLYADVQIDLCPASVYTDAKLACFLNNDGMKEIQMALTKQPKDENKTEAKKEDKTATTTTTTQANNSTSSNKTGTNSTTNSTATGTTTNSSKSSTGRNRSNTSRNSSTSNKSGARTSATSKKAAEGRQSAQEKISSDNKYVSPNQFVTGGSNNSDLKIGNYWKGTKSTKAEEFAQKALSSTTKK